MIPVWAKGEKIALKWTVAVLMVRYWGKTHCFNFLQAAIGRNLYTNFVNCGKLAINTQWHNNHTRSPCYDPSTHFVMAQRWSLGRFRTYLNETKGKLVEFFHIEVQQSIHPLQGTRLQHLVWTYSMRLKSSYALKHFSYSNTPVPQVTTSSSCSVRYRFLFSCHVQLSYASGNMQ